MENTILNPMDLWGLEMSNEEMMAIIKAAPLLLDALKRMKNAPCGQSDDWYQDIARAAIARATGG